MGQASGQLLTGLKPSYFQRIPRLLLTVTSAMGHGVAYVQGHQLAVAVPYPYNRKGADKA